MSGTQTFTHETAQALAEDLAAVLAKHKVKIWAGHDYPCFGSFDGYERFVVIDADDDLRIVEDDPRARPLEWHEKVSGRMDGILAVAPIPTTAHGRLAAAARVDAIRAEQEANIAAFDPDLIDTETSDTAGFVVLRHPLPCGGYVESDALPWSYVQAIQQGRTNPTGWNARVRQLRERFEEAVKQQEATHA